VAGRAVGYVTGHQRGAWPSGAALQRAAAVPMLAWHLEEGQLKEEGPHLGEVPRAAGPFEAEEARIGEERGLPGLRHTERELEARVSGLGRTAAVGEQAHTAAGLRGRAHICYSGVHQGEGDYRAMRSGGWSAGSKETSSPHLPLEVVARTGCSWSWTTPRMACFGAAVRQGMRCCAEGVRIPLAAVGVGLARFAGTDRSVVGTAHRLDQGTAR
jgi:hypothetical protein